jgi:putative cell wall-binding protein
MGKIRTTVVSAIISFALVATGVAQAEMAGASTVTPTPAPTSTTSEPQATDAPEPTDVPKDPVSTTAPDPDPADPGGFQPADPTVSPDSSSDELDAQVKAQEELQSQVPAHKKLSPLVDPLAGSGFDPGYIISDELFYNGNAANAESVQNFLNVMLPSCRSGYVCLKDYSVPTTSRPASAMCNAYNGGGVESAATIIYKVGVACGISQKALLVLLQKEQSLVTDDWPSARQYAAATGYACPDTADCDANYAGFYNQVYWAAYQFKRYGNPPGTSNYFTWYPVGGNSSIRYSPNAACGSSTVVVRNKATAALYYYTPYQPNQAAINGNPDSCSAFGNLNFYTIYSRWFGNPVGVPPVPPIGSLEKVLAASRSFTIAGWAADPTDYSQTSRVRIDVTLSDGSTTSATVDASGYRPDVSFAFPQAGAYRGFSWSIPIGVSGNYRACISALPVAGNPNGPTDLGCRTRFYSASIDATPANARVEGADRYEAAVAMSKASFPSGTTAPIVFVVTGSDYPDALSAGPAAVKQKGSLLLTPRDFLHPSTAAEIRRLNPQRIVVVGGEASVPPAVFTAISKLIPGATTTRIGGADRYEVSRSVATTFFTSAAGVFVATGTNYPDALASGAAAGRLSRPVLLVDGSTTAVDQPTRDALTSLGATSATIVGGPNSVSTGFETSLRSIVTTDRKSGGDRIMAAVNLNASIFSQSNEVYIATGFNFPDALAGSALAGKRSMPLYLVQGNCVPQSVLAEIVRLKATKVTVLGGPNSVSKAAEQLQGC